MQGKCLTFGRGIYSSEPFIYNQKLEDTDLVQAKMEQWYDDASGSYAALQSYLGMLLTRFHFPPQGQNELQSLSDVHAYFDQSEVSDNSPDLAKSIHEKIHFIMRAFAEKRKVIHLRSYLKPTDLISTSYRKANLPVEKDYVKRYIDDLVGFETTLSIHTSQESFRESFAIVSSKDKNIRKYQKHYCVFDERMNVHKSFEYKVHDAYMALFVSGKQ